MKCSMPRQCYNPLFQICLIHFNALTLYLVPYLVFRYNTDAQGTWSHLCSTEYRDSYALGSLGDTLYIMGGQMKLKNQLLMTNIVQRWSLQGGPWRSAAPLPLPLAYHTALRFKNRLYVLGGRTPQVRHERGP